MRVLVISFFFYIVFSVTEGETVDNGANEVFPRTVRFTPPIKTQIGDAENEVIVKMEELPVPRYARSLRNCRYPKITEDSDIFCKIYPSKVICNQTCMFGYTLKGGPKRTMVCHFEEDRWTPVRKFEACQPFVDCTVSLGPGGKMNCKSHFMEHGPVCDISCQHYEDKEAIATRTHQCDINGKWHPRLPFCASPGSNINLVPPPDYD